MARVGFPPLRLRVSAAAMSVAIAAGAFTLALSHGSSSAGIVPVTAQDLVASVLKVAASDPTVSGKVLTHVDLGLPDLSQLPVSGGSGPLGFVQMISGDHTTRVWHQGNDLRVSDMLQAAERSLIVNGTDVWAWDSQTYTAYHLAAPQLAPVASSSMPNAPAPIDPVFLAKQALSAIGPTTSVTVGPNTQVAGQDAYTLDIQPNSGGTLVGRVEIYVDAQRRIPLGIAVYARGADTPAISAMFTSVDFGPVDPSIFSFAPPEGAKVVQVTLPQEPPTPDAKAPPQGGGANPDVRTFGSGWTAVIAVRVPSTELQKQFGGDLSALLPYSGPLLSATLVDRGDHVWLIAGSVPQSVLAAVESELT